MRPPELKDCRIDPHSPFMSALKHMANVPVPAVVVLAVSGQNPLHYLPDRVRLPLDQQVNVVRHQAERVKIESRSFFLFSEQRKKLLTVVRRMKHILPVIAACDHMIKPNFQPRSAASSPYSGNSTRKSHICRIDPILFHSRWLRRGTVFVGGGGRNARSKALSSTAQCLPETHQK